MLLEGGLLAATKDAVSWTGMASLITGISLIVKSRGDNKLVWAQVKALKEANDKDDERDDAKLISEQRAEAFKEQKSNYDAMQEQRNYWKSEAERLQKVWKDHDDGWLEVHKTCNAALIEEKLKLERNAQANNGIASGA